MEAASPPIIQSIKVHQKTFLGVIWGGVAIAIISVSLRTFSRIKFKRLYADDGFVLFALVLVIANAVLWQYHAQEMFDLMSFDAGIETPGPDFTSRNKAYYNVSVAVIIFYYSALWSVKISFLLFFRRLGISIIGQRHVWWPVVVFTVATYFICIGTVQYKCLVDSVHVMMEMCAKDDLVSFQRLSLKLSCAWDVISDFLIMAIPIKLIWGIQLELKKKILLGLLFSLAIITVIFSIVRATVVSSLTHMPDTSWLYMWSAIETTVALVVACLASIRSLFTSSETSTRASPYVPRSSGAMDHYQISHNQLPPSNSFHSTDVRSTTHTHGSTDPERQ